MRKGKTGKDAMTTAARLVSGHWRRTIGLTAVVALLAIAPAAIASPPSPPFSQCPAVGFDSSCQILLVINQQGGLESYDDPSQGNYDGTNSYLIGVQNNSSATVSSISLHGNDPFNFAEGDGLCSGVNESGNEGFVPPPIGCPFGPTEYEGPNTSFSNYKEDDSEHNANDGTVNFGGGLAPGQGAYFSLEALPEVRCSETACEPTGVATSLSGGTESGSSITVPNGTAVSDAATLSGANAAITTGIVSYAVYSDPGCSSLVADAGDVAVSGPAVAGSTAETLPPGTYYWQASYSGDAHNGAAQSPCGSTVETVAPSPSCSKAVGSGHVGAGASRQALRNNVNTSLTGKQRLTFTWNHGEHSVHLVHLNHATCTISGGEVVFSGQGTAAERKEKGYAITFSITAVGGHTYLTLEIEKGKSVVNEFVNRLLILPKKNAETIS